MTERFQEQSNIDSHVDEVDYQLLFEATPNLYLVLKADPPKFTILAVSDSYLDATKIVRSQVLGLGLFEVFPDNPSDSSTTSVSDLRTSLEHVIKEKVQDVMGVQRYDIPSEYNKNTFTVKYWSPINTPILELNGEIRYILHKVEDVTDYILLQEQTSTNTLSLRNIKIDRIEAEVLKSSRDVKEANREIKNLNIFMEHREQELARLNNELTELDKVKTDFFSNISHEFRTPLTLILGPIEDVLYDKNTIPANRNRMEMAHRNALRLLKLVNTLLDFSRLEAGRLKACYRPVNLTELTLELASHFNSAVEKAGLEYYIECESMPELMYVDKNQWEKIVLNLLSNAFKHTFEGKIEISLRYLGKYAELKVKDSGIGIANEQLAHIFERFHQVPNAKSRTHEGSGIGLALVQELVKLHGGTINVISSVDQGSTFTVCIPTGKKHLPAEQINEQPEDDLTPSETQAYVEEVDRISSNETTTSTPTTDTDNVNHINEKSRIMLVDDNSDMRHYVSRLLDPFYEITTVNNGQDALISARANAPDLILSDVMMPIMNGHELVAALRKDSLLQYVPIILLSARAGEEATVESLEIGADDYLIKPFNANELIARVKANLNLYKNRSKAIADLDRISKIKSQFISNMSHELRTPLNAIIGYSDMLLKNMTKSPEQQYKFLENISFAGKHLLELINDILDLSKIEAGKVTLNRQKIEILPFITDIILVLKEIAAKKKVSLHHDIQSNLDYVEADPLRLKQILFNLLNNAIKFNQANGKIELIVKKSTDGLSITWAVRDSGIGIPQRELDQLFTEFYQVDNSSARAHEGTGLGLALSKRLVQLHGGEIFAQSTEGVGSVFTFTIPTSFDKT